MSDERTEVFADPTTVGRRELADQAEPPDLQQRSLHLLPLDVAALELNHRMQIVGA